MGHGAWSKKNIIAWPHDQTADRGRQTAVKDQRPKKCINAWLHDLMEKSQITSTKLQINHKSQAPNNKKITNYK